MDWLSVIMTPQFIGILGPFGVLFLAVCWVLYKFAKRYDAIQEKRIAEAQAMQKEYLQLTDDINKTLNMLMRAVKKQKKSNGQP
jgi:cbb3-type cytochrome oxidase subunit 3